MVVTVSICSLIRALEEGGWGFIKDLITAEIVNKFEPHGSPAGGPRGIA